MKFFHPLRKKYYFGDRWGINWAKNVKSASKKQNLQILIV